MVALFVMLWRGVLTGDMKKFVIVAPEQCRKYCH
jgi:hypothetical protein